MDPGFGGDCGGGDQKRQGSDMVEIVIGPDDHPLEEEQKGFHSPLKISR